MRNLKKILALALALVMAMSLMTVANASDFSDDADISYKEAVDVMTAIGVIDGMDDGSFDPNGTLTREQAAALICRMVLGEDGADRLNTSYAPFDDVAATRWSAPYIAYCVEQGYIVGESDTTFNPTGLLTGHAFAKLLLCVLGYDPIIETYTGASWAVNVASDAVSAGIAVDGLLMGNNITREEAAQMAFQTLTADMVYYTSKGTNITLENGTIINTGASDPTRVANDRSNDYRTASGDRDEYMQYCERYFEDLEARAGDEDDFGRPGTLWRYESEDIGTYGKDADYTLVLDDNYTTDANQTGGVLNVLKDVIDDDDLFLAGSCSFYLNGNGGSGTSYADTDFRNAMNLGSIVEVFVDDDDSDRITDVIVYNYTLYQIDEVDTDVSSSDERDGVSAYVTLSNSETYNNTDLPGYDASTYEEDAYVAAVINDDDKVLESYIPETVEGSVTTRNANDGFVTVDGDRYYVVAATYDQGEFDIEVADVSTSSDDTYALYLDKNGNVIGIDGVETAADINDVYYVDVVWSETSTVAGNKNVTSYYSKSWLWTELSLRSSWRRRTTTSAAITMI